MGELTQGDPQGFSIGRDGSIIGLASLLTAVIYSVFAVGIFRRWGARALWTFWIVSAVTLSALDVWWTSFVYVVHGDPPHGQLGNILFIAFMAVVTAGACLRVVQSGRRSAQPSFARQTLAGCGGMLITVGTLFLAFLLVDLWRLLS
jgi:hypothetical protein